MTKLQGAPGAMADAFEAAVDSLAVMAVAMAEAAQLRKERDEARQLLDSALTDLDRFRQDNERLRQIVSARLGDEAHESARITS